MRPPFAESNFGAAVGTGAVIAVFTTRDTIFVIGGNSKVYYSTNSGVSWTEATWAGAGLAPSFPVGDYQFIQFSNEHFIFKCTSTNSQVTYIITGASGVAKTFDYLYPSDSVKTIGQSICVHENRVLIANGRTIRYSEVGDYSTGYDNNTVNVHSANENILFMYDIQGGLFVFKNNSVFLKNDIDEEGITSFQFAAPVISNFSTIIDVRVFDGDIYALTKGGLFRFNGSSFQELSVPLKGEWFSPGRQNDVWKLGYWRFMKQIYVSNLTTNKVYILDLLTNRWSKIDGTHDIYCCDDATGYLIFADGTNQLKYLNANSYKTGAATIQTPFHDLGNPFMDKYLRGIYFNGDGEFTFKAYGRRNVGETPFELGMTGEGDTTKTVNTGTRTGTGTITSNSTTVTGTGTAFLTEVKQGDVITVDSKTARVQYVTSNTSLTLYSGFSSNVTGKAFTIDRAHDKEMIFIRPDVPWRDISVKVTSSSAGAILKSIGILFDVRPEAV